MVRKSAGAQIAKKTGPLPVLSERLREIRKAKDLSLTEVSMRTGISRSTLYKVENSGVSLTYEKLVHLSNGLGVDISELFHPSQSAQPMSAIIPATRMSTGSLFDGDWLRTTNYDYLYLANPLRRKRMIPSTLRVHKRALEDFGNLVGHPGEEFTIVLRGCVDIHTEYYEPVRLEPGMYLYMDSSMPHAYISVGEGPAEVLTVCSSHEVDLRERLQAVVKKREGSIEVVE